MRLAPSLVTATMAEIYLQQGHTAQALAIYRKLSARAPDDAALRRKVHLLEQRLADEQSVQGKRDAIDRLKRVLRRVQRRRRALERQEREGGAA